MTDKYNPKHLNGIVTASAINENLDDIQDALEVTLSKVPEDANEMKDDLDMNSYRVTNLRDGEQNQDAVTVHQVEDLVRDDLENLGTLDVDITGSASYATNAGHAVTADSASKAGHAVQADNADSLGGIDSSEWQRKHKNNYTAHEDPDLDNDETEGYTEGSIWFNRDTNEAWVCLNAQTNNATWVQTNVSATDLGSAAFVDHGTGMSDVPTVADLSSSDSGEGASLISYENGLNLQQAFPTIIVGSIKDLIDADYLQKEGVTTQVNSFYAGKAQGGSTLYWDSSEDKSEANGITIIDPDNVGTFDGTKSTVETFFNAQGNGTGQGCWKLLNREFLSAAMAGCSGDGSDDDQPLLQRLLDLGSSTQIPIILNGVYSLQTKGTGYLNPILSLKSNTTVIFLNNSYVKVANLQTSASYGILHIEDKENIKIHNPVIIGDYAEEGIPTTPGGHGIRIYGSTNVKIYNPVVSECRGDGIYIGVHGSAPRTPPQNIKIENPHCFDNCRQGLSITASGSTTILNGIFEGTSGAAPEAGIDIEPNKEGDPVNVTFVGELVCKNNNGSGLKVDLNSEKARCTFDTVILNGNALTNKQFIYNQRKTSSPNKASCVIKNLFCDGEGLSIKGPAGGDASNVNIETALLSDCLIDISGYVNVISDNIQTDK